MREKEKYKRNTSRIHVLYTEATMLHFNCQVKEARPIFDEPLQRAITNMLEDTDSWPLYNRHWDSCIFLVCLPKLIDNPRQMLGFLVADPLDNLCPVLRIVASAKVKNSETELEILTHLLKNLVKHFSARSILNLRGCQAITVKVAPSKRPNLMRACANAKFKNEGVIMKNPRTLALTWRLKK